MTDPIVKQALLDLVVVMKDLTALVDSIDKRLYKVEERVKEMERSQQINCYGKLIRD
jgi:hypothetical protein